jgi:hypothetical protein
VNERPGAGGDANGTETMSMVGNLGTTRESEAWSSVQPWRRGGARARACYLQIHGYIWGSNVELKDRYSISTGSHSSYIRTP